MKEIPLTQGKVALVDDDDYETLSNHKWYAQKDRNTFYAQRRVSIFPGIRKMFKMHRVIMGIKDETIKVDHRDGNGLNNLRINLRIATDSENQMNIGKHSDNKMGYKGVSFVFGSKTNPYRAVIVLNKKTIHLGNFKTAIAAARAYDEAAKKYHGEFARMNFPDE